jgi:excinuclease ABC subunit A
MVRTVLVDATPIGRTPASVPATYTGLMETLRELWARVPEARVRGLEVPHFSFNNPRGRCPACEGKGATKVEMQFLADLWLPCEECEGKRFSKEVLDVRWRGKDLAEALDLTVAEALEFFAHQPRAVQILETLRDVGLGYIRLGQASTTLSGGEAQRVKLSAELFRAHGTGRGVVVLDEPTTGLALSDVRHLVAVLDRLAAAGNAVVVVEHHVELLATCDRLVELGPAGGAGGGRVVAAGTPEELAADPLSITGPFLRGEPAARKKPSARPKVKH